MLQINPASTFPICRQIANHTDTGTYYVRGVIKDAINDSVLATVDLDDKGSQYFRYNWKVVYDNVMARGRYITIVTSVYTDSGYTTKSENYGDEINTYVVQERWDSSKLTAFGSSSYSGITASDVRKVIKKELENIKFPEVKEIKFPKQKEYEDSFNNITRNLTDIKALVDGLPTQNNDLRPLIGKLDTLSKALNNRPKFEKTDLKQIDKSVKQLQEVLPKTVLKDVNTTIGDFTKKINKIIKDVMEDTTFKLNIDTSGKVNVVDSEKSVKNTKISQLKSKYGIK